MAFEIDQIRHVVLCSEAFEGVGFVLKDAVFDVAGHSDVEDAALAGENVDVIDLGHASRMSILVAEIGDGCHKTTDAVSKRNFADVIVNGGGAGVRDRTSVCS